MTTKRRLAFYGLLAVVVVVMFWLGGFVYFVNSEDWISAQKEIAKSEKVRSRVGPIQHISLSPLRFSYRFSGDWAYVRLGMKVRGEKAEADYQAELEKIGGQWTIKRVEPR